MKPRRPIRIRKFGNVWRVECLDYDTGIYEWTSWHATWRIAMSYAVGGSR